MTLTRKLEIGFAAALVMGLFTFLYMVVKEREARIRAEVTTEALDKQKQASEKSIQQLEQQIAARDSVSQKQIDALSKIVEQVQTVQDAIDAIPQVANNPLPAQPYVVPQQPTEKSQVLRPGDVVIPKESAPEMWQQYADDHICRQQLTAITQDLADEKHIVLEKQNEVESEKKKTQQWEQTAKGGTKAQRFFGAMKWVGTGIGIGAAAVIAAVVH